MVSREAFKIAAEAYRRESLLALLVGAAPLMIALYLSTTKRLYQLFPADNLVFAFVPILVPIAWMILVVRWHQRMATERYGLVCTQCGHLFIDQSQQIVIATGRCGSCGAQILIDTAALSLITAGAGRDR